MNEPDIEEIVNYLSLKFNKIFYDREFISCVSNDFLKLKSNDNKCCVLVFPALGPVYQRALKYQAKAFDLATFYLSGGTFKSIAVCQKEHLLNDSNQEVQTEKEMSLESIVRDTTTRKKRPERLLYVPPAQRKLALNKEMEHEINTSKQAKPSENTKYKSEIVDIKLKKVSSETIKKEKRMGLKPSEVDTDSGSKEVNIDKFAEQIISLHNLMHLNLLGIPKCFHEWFHKIADDITSLINFHEYSCDFYRYLTLKCENRLEFLIPIFHLTDLIFLRFLIDNYFCWQPLSVDNLINVNEIIENNCAIPFFNYMKNADDCGFLHCDMTSSFTLNQIKLCTKIETYDSARCGIIKFNSIGDVRETEAIFSENNVVGKMLKIVCDNEPFEDIVDLTYLTMGHYFRISSNGCDYFHVCDEDHDVQKCYMEVKKKLTSGNIPQNTSHEEKLPCELAKPTPEMNLNNEEVTVLTEPKLKEKESIIRTATVRKKSEVEVPKEIKECKTKCKHEEEKEIMRKTKENINRKTRPIMKYSDDSDDLLKIDKQENINNWEELFDDSGQIQEELLTEIVQKVGRDMKIVKATEDYTPYMPKPTYDLDHVVEIYDFPPSLSTGDIIHAFSMFDSDSMYIVWVDDTHALLVLGSSSQAQRAMELKNPLIKVRPMTNASSAALLMASQYDLKPAMKRPQTNLQTARRLITNHLGTKSQVTKEQTAKERENLRKAREQRKITRQNERDAWEGNIRSSLRH